MNGSLCVIAKALPHYLVFSREALSEVEVCRGLVPRPVPRTWTRIPVSGRPDSPGRRAHARRSAGVVPVPQNYLLRVELNSFYIEYYALIHYLETVSSRSGTGSAAEIPSVTLLVEDPKQGTIFA